MIVSCAFDTHNSTLKRSLLLLLLFCLFVCKLVWIFWMLASIYHKNLPYFISKTHKAHTPTQRNNGTGVVIKTHSQNLFNFHIPNKVRSWNFSFSSTHHSYWTQFFIYIYIIPFLVLSLLFVWPIFWLFSLFSWIILTLNNIYRWWWYWRGEGGWDIFLGLGFCFGRETRLKGKGKWEKEKYWWRWKWYAGNKTEVVWHNNSCGVHE